MNTPTNKMPAAAEKSIGDIIRETNNLSAEQVAQVLAHQQATGMKFGEAAVDLGLARREDVLWALSQQFSYPYKSQTPKVSEELVVANSPFSEGAEVFRDLRSQLISQLYEGNAPRKAIAVVSPNIGDGKSYFAANVAVAFSQLGGRTLLVDADMRTPRQHEIFGVESPRGLSTILSGRAEPNVIRPVSELPSLYVLPVGVVPPNPLELVQRPAFGMLMRELLSKFDYVIVDTPAAAHGSDARVIASACGAAVVVARQGISEMARTEKLTAAINKTPASVVGVVLNRH